MSFLDKTHKKIDRQKAEELKKLNEETNYKFARFQLDNGVRAQILHPYMENYIVGMTMSDAILAWRPLTDEEKEQIQKNLLKKSGIELPR